MTGGTRAGGTAERSAAGTGRTRSAVVAGGGTGIGLATARVLAAAGWAVTLAGRRPIPLRRSADQLQHECGGPVRAQPVDLAEDDAGERLVTGHLQAFGGLDALVYAAGVYGSAAWDQVTGRHWDEVTGATLRGAALTSAAACRAMLAGDGGRVVLVASVNATHAEPSSGAYSAAKAGVSALARSITVDLGARGVIANAVSPGWVRTAMTERALAAADPAALRRLNPLGRVGEPAELAAVIGYLVLQAPDFLAGATLCVDGGQGALAPTLG